MPPGNVLSEGDLVAGRYRIASLVGRGGTGEVYAAEHVWTGRRVALKLLREELADSERATARFLREARTLSQLAHPNIVQVLDMGQDESDGALFLAQELLTGEDLRALLARRGRLQPAEAVALLMPIADALSHAHGAGLVHRDVTPSNVFLHESHGRTVPRLIDFGIARRVVRDASATVVTQQGAPVGTPMYMSPEQARGDVELDARTDVWSLAVVLYECMAGAPYEAASAPVVYAKILTEGPPPLRARAPELPAELESVLARALAGDRRDRFATMDDFARALSNVVTSPDPDAMAGLLERPIAAGASSSTSTRTARTTAPETGTLDPASTMVGPAPSGRARRVAAAIAVVALAGAAIVAAAITSPWGVSPAERAPTARRTSAQAPRVVASADRPSVVAPAAPPETRAIAVPLAPTSASSAAPTTTSPARGVAQPARRRARRSSVITTTAPPPRPEEPAARARLLPVEP